MKKFFVFVIVFMLSVSANAEMIAKGVCNASSRNGWNITSSNINSISEWIDAEEGMWYSHISCAESFDNVTVAFAVTLPNGFVLSEEQVFNYLDTLMFSGMSTDEIIDVDAKMLGIIEGIYGGFCQIEQAVDLTFNIHNEKEAIGNEAY